MTDRVRVLRVLEYEGPREWVEHSIRERSVKGERKFLLDGCIIRESIIGETPAVLVQGPDLGDDTKRRMAERLEAAQLRARDGKRSYHWSGCPRFQDPTNPGNCNCVTEPGP